MASGIMAADARQAEFEENIRRVRLKKAQTVGLATAMSAASGMMLGSRSTDAYLGALTGQFNTEISQLQKAAELTGVADFWGTASDLFGGGASAIGIFNKEQGG
jgi:hypothetical protein